jgi:hypothetical protein
VYTADGPERYDVRELSLPGSPPYRALAVTEDGTILATSSPDGGPLNHYWLWRAEDDIQPIPPGGDTVGSVATMGGIDSAGRVFVANGALGVPPGIVRWHGSESMVLPMAADNLPISLSKLSPTGWLAGTAEVNSDNTRADRAKPARWSPDGLLEINSGIDAGVGGSAVSIAFDGTAITRLHRGAGQTESYLWSPDGAMKRLNILPYGFAIGISDAYDVVGIRLNGPERQAVRSSNHETWLPLGPPPGWEPTHVAPNGLVVGTFRRDGFSSAWVQDTGNSLTPLPGYSHHHHQVVASSAHGWLVGTASTERCSHAMLWTRQPGRIGK